MITEEKRIKIAIFIYQLNLFLKDLSSVRVFVTVEKLTKIKEIIEWMKDFFPNFTLFQNEPVTEIDYNDMLEDVINSHSVENSFKNLSKEDFIAKLRQMIIDEFEYESENNLLPCEGSKGIAGIIGTGEIANNIQVNMICPYDNHSYTYTFDEITQNYIRLTVKGRYEGRKKERFLNINLVNRFDYIDFSITPSPRDYSEKEWLQKLLLTVLMDYTSFAINIDFFVEKINEMIEKINSDINILNTLNSDSIDIDNLSEEDSSFIPENNIRSYSHRTVSIPIMGNLMGVELEFKGDVRKVFRFGRSFERLINLGWILEKDGSVDFELKSPIMDLAEIQKVFKQNYNLFDDWAIFTDSSKAGLHFHISTDDSFSINKRPASSSKLFMVRLVQTFESTTLKNSTSRKVIFKRDYQSYCDEYGESTDCNERYRWINFQNLDRDAGKTIEIRLFSASAANELDKAAERALLIVKLFKYALKDWRAKNRPDFMTWQQSFGDTKIFKALFNNEERKRWVELFTLPVKAITQNFV